MKLNLIISKTITTFLACLVMLQIKAADSTSCKLILGTGISNFRVTDHQVSPLISSTDFFPLILGYNHQNSKSYFTFVINGKAGLTQTPSFREREILINSVDENGEPTSENITVKNSLSFSFDITMEYLRKTSSLQNNRVNVYTGLMLKQYFLMEDKIAPIIMNQISFNPKIAVTYQYSDKIRFNSSLSFSLFSFNTRLNYSNDPYSSDHSVIYTFFDEGTKFKFPNDFQRTDFHLGANYRINQKWDAGIDYSFLWYNQQDNLGIKAYENSVNIVFYRTFKNRKS